MILAIEIDTTEMPAHCQLANPMHLKVLKSDLISCHFTADFKILQKIYESHHINIKLNALENVSYLNEFHAIDFASRTPGVP